MNTASLPTEWIVNACVIYLDDRKREINERREKMIRARMEAPRWWGFAAKYTREQAIALLKDSSGFDFYSAWEMAAWPYEHEAGQVRALHALASLAHRLGTATITVDENSAGFLYAKELEYDKAQAIPRTEA